MPFDKKEYMKEYNKQYRANNKEKFKEYENKPQRIKYIKDYAKKNKEHLQQKQKEWGETPTGIKSNKIKVWKKIGIRCNDEWEEVYDWYGRSTNCDICDKPFTASIDKCLDHDHHLDGYNIRGILCKKCNNFRNEL